MSSLKFENFKKFENKHLHKSLTNPQDLIQYFLSKNGALDFDCPQNIILYYLPLSLEHLNREYGDRSSASGYERKAFFTAKMDIFKNKNIGIVHGFGFGAPAMALQLEILIALGAKRFVSVGTAGAIAPHLKGGDLLLCSQAIRDEGVSRHYADSKDDARPDPNLYTELQKVLTGKNIKFFEMPTWTTDAVYRETSEEVHYYREHKVGTVDMEAAALFTVARYRGVPAASLFAVSDIISSDKWMPQFHLARAPLKALLRVAIETLTR